MHIFGGVDNGTVNALQLSSTTGTTSEYGFFSTSSASDYLRFGYWTGAQLGNVFIDVAPNGRVGIGTNAPDQMLSVNGGASKSGGGSWSVFSDERLKNIKGPFTTTLCRWWAIIRKHYPRGVFRFRTTEDAQKAREKHRPLKYDHDATA